MQPPLPLQLFLPLQPLSPVLQPPWPLQAFMPLQSCLAVDESEALVPALPLSELQPVVIAIVPVINPAMAAERMSALVVFVIVSVLVVCLVKKCSKTQAHCLCQERLFYLSRRDFSTYSKECAKKMRERG